MIKPWKEGPSGLFESRNLVVRYLYLICIQQRVIGHRGSLLLSSLSWIDNEASSRPGLKVNLKCLVGNIQYYLGSYAYHQFHALQEPEPYERIVGVSYWQILKNYRLLNAIRALERFRRIRTVAALIYIFRCWTRPIWWSSSHNV